MTAKKRRRLPTLEARAPELVRAIDDAVQRRARAMKKVGGVKVCPPTADAEHRWRKERPGAPTISAEQCLASAGWYLGEAVCLGFTHERRPNKREGNAYSIPCQNCLEAGMRAVQHAYTKGVKQ